MKDQGAEQIIADRYLYLPGDNEAKVFIKIFRPHMSDSQNFACDCSIENLVTGEVKKLSAGGVDFVQALLIALCILGMEVKSINKAEFNSNLVCFPESKVSAEFNCGFPVYDEKFKCTVFM